MCTKNEEQNTSSIKSGDINVTINKQQSKYGATNPSASDNPSVDFRIQTNIELISDKKIKICLIINILVSVVFITSLMICTYKLYAELLHVQSEMLTLNAKFASLSEMCEHMKYEDQNISMDSVHAEPHTMSDSGVGIRDGNYDFIKNESDTIRNRLRRANRRKENTSRRKLKSSGALAAHFKGSVPEIIVRDQDLVGPWYLDGQVSRQYNFPKFHLTEGHCSIEVTEPALYLIYAQVYYVTSNPVSSYSVFVRSEGSSENNLIAKCSTVGPKNLLTAEISCYTSTVYSLKANDRIFIRQIEKNRTIILRDGHSFFGLVRLNNSYRINKS